MPADENKHERGLRYEVCWQIIKKCHILIPILAYWFSSFSINDRSLGNYMESQPAVARNNRDSDYTVYELWNSTSYFTLLTSLRFGIGIRDSKRTPICLVWPSPRPCIGKWCSLRDRDHRGFGTIWSIFLCYRCSASAWFNGGTSMRFFWHAMFSATRLFRLVTMMVPLEISKRYRSGGCVDVLFCKFIWFNRGWFAKKLVIVNII